MRIADHRLLSMEDGVCFSIFRFLATVLAVAIVLPGVFLADNSSFVLSFAVLVFARLVDSVKGAVVRKGVMQVFHSLECLLDIGSLGCFFFYMALFMNMKISDGHVCNYMMIVASAMYVFSDFFFCMLLFRDYYRTRQMAAVLAAAN